MIEVFWSSKLLTLFRGQNSDKPLLPRIARNTNLQEQEEKIFEEFKRWCPRFVNTTGKSDWELMAIAQHHWLPTRLLDWTKNPLVALWFACNTEKKKGDWVVWLLPVYKEDIVNKNTNASVFEGQKTQVYQPDDISERIISQWGWFTVHKKIQKKDNKFIPLEKNNIYKDKLIKIIIPRKFFKKFRQILSKMWIDEATLFPDINWMCKHIAWSKLWK